jgi:membrane protease YdiL (CAAX protease family)
MKYVGIALGSSLLIIASTFVSFKLGTLDTIHSHLGQLVLWSIIAVALSRTALKVKTTKPRSIIGFRELVVLLSVVFATLCANVGSQYLQMKVFGRTYTSSYADAEPSNSSDDESAAPPSVPASLCKMLLSVTAEEIPSRWITLGALLMIMPPVWALLISSALFALTHLIVPTLVGHPEAGLFFLAPTFMIGLGAGFVFIRSALPAAILVHFLVNLVALFSSHHTGIADTVTFGSAFVALCVLPMTLWFTRKRETADA